MHNWHQPSRRFSLDADVDAAVVVRVWARFNKPPTMIRFRTLNVIAPRNDAVYDPVRSWSVPASQLPQAIPTIVNNRVVPILQPASVAGKKVRKMMG